MSNQHRVSLLSFVVATLCLTPAWGQDADPPEPAPLPPEVERRLTEQDARIKKLEQQLKAGDQPAGKDAAKPAGKKDDDKFELGLFYVRSKDKSHELNLHARIMLDGRFDLAHDYIDNTFQVRRARVTFEGHVFKYVGYKLGLEFGRTSDADVRDAYIKLGFVKELQLFGGQMILPFSTSRFTSSNYLKHPERPIAVALLSGLREIGFQLYGELLDNQVTYYLGIFNGNGQNRRVDNDDDMDLAARVEVRPIKGLQLSAAYVFSPTNHAALGPLGARTVGLAAASFLNYDLLNNQRRGKRHRLNGGARFRMGPFEAKGEVLADYQREVRPAAGAGRDRNLLTFSWFIDASFVLTGEKSGSEIVPDTPFYGPGGFGPGAFELAVRFEDFQADPETRRGGFAIGTDRARAGTVTLTWIPIQRLRWMFSYTGTAFDHDVVDQSGRSHRNDHTGTLRLHFFF